MFSEQFATGYESVTQKQAPYFADDLVYGWAVCLATQRDCWKSEIRQLTDGKCA
jgi:hypothetical protein